MQNKKLEDNSETLQHGNSQTTAQRRSRSAKSGGEGPIGYGSYDKWEVGTGRSELSCCELCIFSLIPISCPPHPFSAGGYASHVKPMLVQSALQPGKSQHTTNVTT